MNGASRCACTVMGAAAGRARAAPQLRGQGILERPAACGATRDAAALAHRGRTRAAVRRGARDGPSRSTGRA